MDNITFKRLNRIAGWAVFLISSFVYLITVEPTVSFWDCGEYIATAFKLQVGHPPGAPFFQLAGRFFSLFAFGNEALVARMVNSMSAISSGLTILFLFWSVTLLARKMAASYNNLSRAEAIAILGSGLVGALAYTFSDSFWFSAVEGEVYAMSSFFTALVFWAILKWEQLADEKHAYRWIIFIAYAVGLSIGVHLLNLLAIPAITMVYYFKMKKNPTTWGIIRVMVLSFVILAFVMYGIIPWIVKLAGYFELLFVNGFGLPFNSGTVVYFVLLIGGIIYGLKYTYDHGKTVLNTIILGFIFLLIGYSSFFMLVIRSNANPPIDENNPENAISLLSYLNREQYGDYPLFYGNYYNAPVIDRKDGTPVYSKDPVKKKYVITDKREGVIPVYDERFMTVFPRMWSNSQSDHASEYIRWGQVKGEPVSVRRNDGTNETINKPTFGENLRFFFNYQISHMYIRYFMWNFVGRQNDNQGTGDVVNGNWISGINFIDEARLGPQENIPDSLRSKARNRFYFLPLLLGLAGLFFHINRNHRGAIVVALLFFMTGLAIVIYLNQYSMQPRERDYAFSASFYAFAIWIGLGVMAIIDAIGKKRKSSIAAVLVTVACLVLVPGIMAKEGWDDHDRSGRVTALEIAENYLNSCAPNAILFTNGDNDTFPLWYAQEVEGIRTDVRVINLSLLNTDWYIDQMKRKAYESEAVPFSLTPEQYRQGTRDYVYFIERDNIQGAVDLTELFNLIQTDEQRLKFNSQIGVLDYFPTKTFKIRVDTALVLANGTVQPEDAGEIVSSVEWTVNDNGVQKNSLMVLDLIANFGWKRPVYFAITTGDDAYVGLMEYFQVEGLAYRFVPIRTVINDGQNGRLNTRVMYDNLMNKFKASMNDPGLFYSYDNVRMSMNLRNSYGRLALALVDEGKPDSAIAVCDRCLEMMPDEAIPYNFFMLNIVEAYYRAQANDKANTLVKRLIDIYRQELVYYFAFKGEMGKQIDRDKQQALAVMQRISQIAGQYQQKEVADEGIALFDEYYGLYIGDPSYKSPVQQQMP